MSVSDGASLGIAALSLVVSVLAYRASGPRLVVRSYVRGDTAGDLQIVVEVENRSRAAVPFAVEALDYSGWHGDRQIREGRYQLAFTGEQPLPYRLPPWEREVWTAPANELHGLSRGLSLDWVVLRVRIGWRHRRVRVRTSGPAIPAGSPPLLR